MSWVSLILPALKLILALTQRANEKRLLDAGQDQAIASAALEVLGTTAKGRELRDQISSLSDPEADLLWEKMLRGD